MSQSSFVSASQNSVTGKTRRSTRVDKTIPLIILGQTPTGEPFMERTLSVSVNMHGCRYPSRHEFVVGTWVTLQVVSLNIPDQKPTTVRAVVRSVHPPPIKILFHSPPCAAQANPLSEPTGVGGDATPNDQTWLPPGSG